MKFYIDDQGNYLGGWDDELAPPAGAIEIDYPPIYADQKWLWSGWGSSLMQDTQREDAWRTEELAFIADQLIAMEDADPSALPGTDRQWRDYRIALRSWKDGAEHYPDMRYRPQRPV